MTYIEDLVDLTPGRAYRLDVHDCCVSATLTGVFQGVRYCEDEPDFPDALIFDIGEFGNTDCVLVTELDASTTTSSEGDR